MGLPVFREPQAPENKPKTATDPSAAARSTIRRSRTLGRNLRARDHASTSSSTITARRQGSNNMAGQRTLLEIAEADLARTEASNRRRLETGRALLRDALSFERPSRALGDPVTRDEDLEGLTDPPPPPVPEPSHYRRRILPDLIPSSNRTESHRTESLDGSDGRRRLDLSLPYDHHANLSLARVHGGPLPSTDSSSYSSRFAPAYRFGGPPNTRSANVDRIITSLLNRVRGEMPSSPRPGVQPPDESTGDGEAPTSQTSRPSNVATNGSSLSRHGQEDRTGTIDGLGDRERSLSPEDNWDTLLTTITPDNQLPSADSSFTSATASASSMPSQATSTSTSITAPEEAEISPICDLTSSDSDDLSMTEPEPDDELFSMAPRFLGNPGYDNQGSSTTTDPTIWEQRRRLLDGAPDDDHTHQRRPRRRRLNDAESFDRLVEEQNLRDMHRILDTLARREDIPDDWWAAVGLRRNLPRPLSGERERGSR